jgi:hypothetical protein
MSVTIFVNWGRFTVDSKTLTGQQIRSLLQGLPDEPLLHEVLEGRASRLVAPDEVVTLHDGQRFHTATG